MADKVLTNGEQRLWRLMIWVVGLSTPVIASLKPRSFIADGDVVAESGDLSHLISQGLYLFFLMLAIIAFAHRPLNNPKQRYARVFWFSTILMAAMPTISSLITGGTLQLTILGVLGIYSATYFLPAPPVKWWIKEARVMLLVVFVYGSLVAAVLFPDWAWNKEYEIESSVAVIPMRLFGTANHANSLAPLAVFAWMLGRFPGCRLKGEYVHGMAILLVLFLAQSKTIWAIALFLLGIYILIKLASLRGFRRYLAYLAVGAGSFAFAVYVTRYSAYAGKIEDALYDPQVLTLTGRLPIWLYAVEIWLGRPWIGQGLDAWSSRSVADNATLLGWAAPTAHNQVLQVLTEAGLVGFCVMALWVRYIILIARKAPAGYRTPLWWLCAFYFLPGFTEVVLAYNIGLGATVTTWIIFTLVMVTSKAGDGNKEHISI